MLVLRAGSKIPIQSNEKSQKVFENQIIVSKFEAFLAGPFLNDYWMKRNDDIQNSFLANRSDPITTFKLYAKEKRPLRSLFTLKFHPILLKFIDARTLTFYYWCRMRFAKGIFYDFNINKFKNLVGCSADKAKRYLAKLEKVGLVKMHHGNLCFKDIKVLYDQPSYMYKKRTQYFKINIHDVTEKEIGRLIVKMMIIDSMTTQEYLVRSRSLTNNVNTNDLTKKRVKVMKSHANKYTGNFTKQVFLSYRKLSKQLRISKDKISQDVKQLISKGELYATPLKFKLEKSNTIDVDIDIPGHRYLWNGNLYVYAGTQYSVPCNS